MSRLAQGIVVVVKCQKWIQENRPGRLCVSDVCAMYIISKQLKQVLKIESRIMFETNSVISKSAGQSDILYFNRNGFRSGNIFWERSKSNMILKTYSKNYSCAAVFNFSFRNAIILCTELNWGMESTSSNTFSGRRSSLQSIIKRCERSTWTILDGFSFLYVMCINFSPTDFVSPLFAYPRAINRHHHFKIIIYTFL